MSSQSDENVIKNLEVWGDEYYKKYLQQYKDLDLDKDEKWLEALKFFFSHSFMRGRPDKLSNEYCSFTIKTLEDHIFNKNSNDPYEELKTQKEHLKKKDIQELKNILKLKKELGKKDENIEKGNENLEESKKKIKENPIIESLTTPKKIKVKWDNKPYTKEISLENEVDIIMVLDVLKFISDDDNKKNIYQYLKKTIIGNAASKESGIKTAYDKLTKIEYIGDKLAAFIIRDIILLINPDIEIKYDDYKLIFPVDTWVTKIAHKLGCSSSEDAIKHFFIEKCIKDTSTDSAKVVKVAKVAAGLWFFGYNSLDILIENCLKNNRCIKKIHQSNWDR